MAKSGTGAGGGEIVGIVIATLLASCFGAGTGWLLPPRSNSGADKPSAAAYGVGASSQSELSLAGGKPEHAGDQGSSKSRSVAPPPPSPLATKTVALPTIMTAIGNPHSTWLRLEVALVAAADEHGVEEQLGQLGDDMVSYLRTIEISQIEGPSGLRFLKDDLLDRAKTRTNGQIQDIVIKTLVLE